MSDERERVDESIARGLVRDGKCGSLDEARRAVSQRRAEMMQIGQGIAEGITRQIQRGIRESN